MSDYWASRPTRSGVHIENMSLTFPGYGTAAEAQRTIVDRPAAYPENAMLGTLPAYAFYLRHARGVTLDRVHVELAAADRRPAIACDDVADIRITGLVAAASRDVPLIRMADAQNALLQGCARTGEQGCFVEIGGMASRDIALLGNDLRGLQDPIRKSGGFTGEVSSAGNLH